MTAISTDWLVRISLTIGWSAAKESNLVIAACKTAVEPFDLSPVGGTLSEVTSVLREVMLATFPACRFGTERRIRTFPVAAYETG